MTKEQSIQEERAGDRVRKVVQLCSTPEALVKSVVEESWGLWYGLRMYNLIGPLKLLIFCKKENLIHDQSMLKCFDKEEVVNKWTCMSRYSFRKKLESYHV